MALVALVRFVVCFKNQKLVYRVFESVPIIEVSMRLPGAYRMSEDEVVEFLVEGNTTSDNHFMNFHDLLKTTLYSIIILLSSNRQVFFPVLSGWILSSKRPVPDPILGGNMWHL